MKIKPLNPNFGRWLVVVIYALAMAWVEAAVVFYLRSHIDRIEPYQPTPLPHAGGFGFAEGVREMATLIMLFTVGLLAGKNWRARFGYTFLAFGVWDIFYYVFLKVICDWPHSLFDWDILFLVPLPWWGPVLAPVLIAALMICWGTLVTQFEQVSTARAPRWKTWLLNFAGAALALYVFMADALRASDGGVEALRNLLPAYFNWPLFCVALIMMSAPVVRLFREIVPARRLSVEQTVTD